MRVSVETEEREDGVHITRRFEDGKLVRTWRHHALPSGKQTASEYDADGAKRQEIHSHAADLILTIDVRGAERYETYSIKGEKETL